MEYFDIVDENDKIISKASRKDCHNSPNLIHRGVFIFLFNRNRQIFVQKRGEGADTYPGVYDCSASGHVETDHKYSETAFRELKEELGVDPEMLIPMFKFKWSDGRQSEFIKVFFCFHDGEIKINHDELADGRFWYVDELKKSMDNGEEKFLPSFKIAFEKYYREFWSENERNGEDEEGGS